MRKITLLLIKRRVVGYVSMLAVMLGLFAVLVGTATADQPATAPTTTTSTTADPGTTTTATTDAVPPTTTGNAGSGQTVQQVLINGVSYLIPANWNGPMATVLPPSGAQEAPDGSGALVVPSGATGLEVVMPPAGSGMPSTLQSVWVDDAGNVISDSDGDTTSPSAGGPPIGPVISGALDPVLDSAANDLYNDEDTVNSVVDSDVDPAAPEVAEVADNPDVQNVESDEYSLNGEVDDDAENVTSALGPNLDPLGGAATVGPGPGGAAPSNKCQIKAEYPVGAGDAKITGKGTNVCNAPGVTQVFVAATLYEKSGRNSYNQSGTETNESLNEVAAEARSACTLYKSYPWHTTVGGYYVDDDEAIPLPEEETVDRATYCKY